MIVNTICGFSGSSRPDHNLGAFVERILAENNIRCDTRHRNSASRHCVENTISFLTKYPDQPACLIGKSLGAVRTWWAMYKFWEQLQHRAPISVILVDPHGWQRGDRRLGPYKPGRAMRYNKAWNNMDVDFTVMRQTNKGIKGARLSDRGASRLIRDIKLDHRATHWNVTERNTATGDFVAKIIKEELKKLLTTQNT